MENNTDFLEKRLANTETALVGLWSLMKDTMPPDYQRNIEVMMNEYFDANNKLGADFSSRNGFIET